MLIHAATVFMGFFAIMNPIANVPIFLSLTASDDGNTRKRIALRSLLLAFGIVAAFSVAGKVIFELFGMTLPALRITGGLFSMSVTMGAFALLCLITYAFFLLGERFVCFIGEGALGVITRMMGLILAVIGTQMAIEGVHGVMKLRGY